MVDIAGSVGDGGVNAKSDVAIVQLMLRLIKNAKGVPYYSANYTGSIDAATNTALTAFQKDQKIALPDAKAAATAGPAAEKSGFVKTGSITFAKMAGALPAKYVEMRAIANTTTVYLPAKTEEATASSSLIASKADLDATFRVKVAAVVDTMYQRNKIALGVVGPGWRRSFALQFAQTKTGAGPGESNHNFGRAVDLGFVNFTWMKGDGSFVKEGGWLGSTSLGGVKSEQLWAARDAIAITERGLFLTNFGHERVHLQSFSDAKANNRASLAKLLTTVGTMKWQHKTDYQTNLGVAATFVDAGTAKQIWSGKATVNGAAIIKAATGQTLATLSTNALYAKLTAVKAFIKASALNPTLKTTAGKAALVAKDVVPADVATFQSALKAEFEAADTNWVQWLPVL